MKVVCDVEADGLHPTKIHLIVCKEVETGHVRTFRDLYEEDSLRDWEAFVPSVSQFIGHNFLGYDIRALHRLCGTCISSSDVVDTLVLSRLLDENRVGGHSLAAWGERLHLPKLGGDIEDWSVRTEEMERRCLRDVEINYLLYRHFQPYLESSRWKSAIETEHYLASLCPILSENGFAFDLASAISLKEEISAELAILDKALETAFTPRSSLVREITPRVTKHGTLNRSDFRFVTDGDLTPYSEGASFSLVEFIPFNPASAPQRVERLNEAGWKPTEKTKGHREAEKELRTLNRKRRKTPADLEAIEVLKTRLERYKVYGWTISEENLKTLPPEAPPAAKTLVRRLLLGGRFNILGTWLAAVQEHGDHHRIHGTFNPIGAWTQRMSHDKPNMGNIPKFDERQPEKTPYSDRMRRLWVASPNRLLVGVDAESIQLRIFAHYLHDEEFVQSLIRGDKALGTDPHSVNQRALGSPCKSRDDAKTFIYAFLLGAGIGKVADILRCTKDEAEEAVRSFIDRYPGLAYLRREVIPNDAKRGYFTGLDGRLVRIFGDDVSSREHFTLAGYLQNGEKIIMSRAVQIWYPKLVREGVPFWWVNFVHDEFQTETIDDIEVAKHVARTQADAIREVGVDLNLRCPFAGSAFSDHGTLIDGKKWAIGKDWYVTH